MPYPYYIGENMFKAFTILTLFCLSQMAFSLTPQERAEKLRKLKNPGDDQHGVYEERDDGDGLAKVMEQFPDAKKLQGQCRTMEKNNDPNFSNFGSVPDCIWAQLPEQKKKEIQEFLSKSEEGSDESTDYDGVDLNNFRQKKTKTIAKLEGYLQKRLNEALYGNDQGKIRAAADHQVFHRIYQSQLGKNVINGLSSFCLEAKEDGKGKGIKGQQYVKYKIPEDSEEAKKVREENIKKLAEKGAGEGPQAFDHFNTCISSVSLNCEQGASDTYSQNRACEVLKFIKSMKFALKEVEAIQDRWKERGEGFAFGQVQGQVKNDVDVDKIVNVTSNEVYDKSEIQGVAKEEAEILKKCEENYQGNKGECDKYLIDQDKKNDMMDEYALRNIAMNEKVQNAIGKKKPNKEGVKKYLEELGYSEDKIGSILGNPEELKKVHQMISQRFENEKDAVVALMKKRMDGRSIDKDALQKNPDAAKSTFANLKEEMESSPERYKELIHYSNVVGAFLSVEGADGKEGKNTKALKAELADSAFAPGGRTIASGGDQGKPDPGIKVGDDHLKKLEKMAPGTGSDGDTTNLTSQQLDEIIQLGGDAKKDGDQP